MKRRNTTLEPKDISPEQRRLSELSKIASERRSEAVRARGAACQGLWFAEQFLPDDLKQEYRKLTAAQTQRRGAARVNAGSAPALRK